jgi:LCP family protein required for cell wall assembly
MRFQPRRRRLGIRIAVRALVGAALLVGIAAGAIVTQAIIQRRTPTDVMADYGLPVIESPQSHFHKDRVALLLMGIDYDYNAQDEEYSSDARADTIKAVSLDLPTPENPTGSISMLSVPRDTDVVLPSGRENKINSAYGGFNGNSAAAAHNEERVVAKFLGLPGFDRYLTLRINATKELIDAIGGIDVVPDETMNYDDNWGHLHIHFIGGKKYHMNGTQAVSYARFRHDACSDPCRIKRQDQVIKLAIAKLKSDKFNDLLHINQLIDVVRRNVYTDLSPREILSLAWAYQHIDLAKIDAKQVPFVADKELACCGDVLIADDSAKAALVKKMFVDPLPTPVAAAAVAAIDPSSVKIAVENGSGVRGQGARVAAALRKQGFTIASVGDADSFGYDATEIHVRGASPAVVGERIRAALALKSATIDDDPTPGPSTGDVATVIVGRDVVP